MKTVQAAFDVRLISPIFSAGEYRIFVERNDLIFIQIEGGARSVLEAAAPLLGPFGGLIPLVLWLFTKRKAKARRQRIEESDPEDLLRDSEKNFKLYAAEIRDASIDTGSLLVTRKGAGRLGLLVRHGEKIRCEFKNTAEMSRAIQLLSPLLNSTLKINVIWNAQKQRFDKKKKS